MYRNVSRSNKSPEAFCFKLVQNSSTEIKSSHPKSIETFGITYRNSQSLEHWTYQHERDVLEQNLHPRIRSVCFIAPQKKLSVTDGVPPRLKYPLRGKHRICRHFGAHGLISRTSPAVPLWHLRTLQKTTCRQTLTFKPKGPADHKSALSCLTTSFAPRRDFPRQSRVRSQLLNGLLSRWMLGFAYPR